ncbi:hypothetical protein Tco_0888264 [Tanacetum coccineum]
MNNPNLTMEEYVRLEEEKALSIPVNDEIDFRISFDESDDEDYTIICDKNSFSYKMISVNNLKMDSENDYEEVMPSILSPEPAISCFDDLDFFKDFENEFPAIIYNDAKMSKSDLLTKPILNPQHIDEFDLNDETSLSEYDEEEQNVLYFNDLFPFNIIRSDDLKSEKDNDNNEIDITQSLLDNEITHGSTMLFETSHDKVTKTLRMESFVINLNVKVMIWIYYANGMLFYLIMNLCAPFGVPFDPKRNWSPRMDTAYSDMAFLPSEQRHRFLRYEGLEYTNSDIADFESRMAMEHRDEAGVVVFTSQAWRRLFDTRGPLVWDLILEFLSTLRFGEVLLDLDALDTIQFQLGGARRRLSCRQFIMALGLHTREEMESPGFARRFSAKRKSGAHISGGQFMARLAEHFGLLTVEILGGLMFEDTWDVGGHGTKKARPDLRLVANCPCIAEMLLLFDEGTRAVPTPVAGGDQAIPTPQ